MDSVNLLTIISIAFLGSFGHCIGMCGGIVIAYTSTKVESRWSKAKQATSHLLYSFGRILTYTILGALFGYLGSVATFSAFANGVLLVTVGLLRALFDENFALKHTRRTVAEHLLKHLTAFAVHRVMGDEHRIVVMEIFTVTHTSPSDMRYCIVTNDVDNAFIAGQNAVRGQREGLERRLGCNSCKTMGYGATFMITALRAHMMKRTALRDIDL